ncbi:MAG: hypothetical protein MHPSP_003832, partial [Paramarteilia canceri]
NYDLEESNDSEFIDFKMDTLSANDKETLKINQSLISNDNYSWAVVIKPYKSQTSNVYEIGTIFKTESLDRKEDYYNLNGDKIPRECCTAPIYEGKIEDIMFN